MTDGWLMEADCVHGFVWYECAQCNDDICPGCLDHTDGARGHVEHLESCPRWDDGYPS